MKAIFVVLILLIILLAVAPVMAQDDAVVVDYGTQVITQNPDNQLYQFVVIGLLFILMVSLTVLGYSIRQLAQSAPAWMRELIKPMINQALQGVELVTDATPNTIDDDLLKEIHKIIDGILNSETAIDAVTDAVEVSPDANATA